MKQNKRLIIISGLCFMLLSFGCSSKNAEQNQKAEVAKAPVTITAPTAVAPQEAAGLAKLKTVPLYSLNEGRGDPFVVPVGKRLDKTGKGTKISKIPVSGYAVEQALEMAVQGILRSGKKYFAILTSPTGNHIVRPGDKVGQYKISSITPKAVIVSWEKNTRKLVLGEEVKAEKSELKNNIPVLPQIPGKDSGIQLPSQEKDAAISPKGDNNNLPQNPQTQNPSPSETPGRAPAQ